VPHRRRSLIEALSRKVSVEARRLSALGSNLHELRKALNRLTRELLVCVAIIIGIWQLLSDTLWRLLSSFWR
jgi:hypothetical protein